MEGERGSPVTEDCPQPKPVQPPVGVVGELETQLWHLEVMRSRNMLARRTVIRAGNFAVCQARADDQAVGRLLNPIVQELIDEGAEIGRALVEYGAEWAGRHGK